MQEQHPLKQPAYPPGSSHALEQVQAELQAQRRLLEENNHMLKSLRRSMRMGYAFAVLKVLLFLIPLALAAIFLPPFLREWFDTIRAYQEAISVSADPLPAFDMQQLRELLQKSGVF